MLTYRISDADGPAAQERLYAAYYGSIAQRHAGRIPPAVVRHELRPEIGRGSVEVTNLRSGLRIVRYDVCFADEHRIRFDFDADRFELEVCVDGGVRIEEKHAGADDLGAAAVSLTPPRATAGQLVHPAGRPYRAVSVTGRRSSLAPYLGGVGAEEFAAALTALDAERSADLYLGRDASLPGVQALMSDLFALRAETPGKTLLMESKVMALLGEIMDFRRSAEPRGGFAAHEIEAVQAVPDILWRERHEPPTVAQLAQRLFMSPRRLTGGFKEVFGVTPVQYHRRRCLERAANMLVDTDWTVERIALEVGYAAASNFVYAFRQRFGRTPAEYRRLIVVGDRRDAAPAPH